MPSLVVIILLAIIILALILFLKKAIKGIPRKLTELKKPVEGLLQLGKAKHNSFLLISRKNSNQFVQLRLANDETKEIEIAFPKVKWSEAYYTEVLTYAKENKLKTIRKVEQPGNVEFTYINLGNNLDYVYSTLKDFLIKIFDARNDTIFYVMLDNIYKDK